MSFITTVAYNKLSISKFDITKPEDNDRVPSQKISYIRYKGKDGRTGQLYVKTPRIHMSSGGIPPEGKFFETALKRAKGFKIPFNTAERGGTPEEVAFQEKMIELDMWFSSEEFKRDVLGWSDKTSAAFDYVPIVRTPQEKDDDDDEEENEEKAKAKKAAKEKREKYGPKPKYMKPFFELEYQTDKVLVKMYEKVDDKNVEIEDINEINEASKYLNWNCYAKYILTPNKLYATKQKDPKTNRKTYGITFKVVCVEVEPSVKLGGKQELPADPFISDGEDEDDIKQTAKKITKMSLKEMEAEEVDYGTVDESYEVEQAEGEGEAEAVVEEEELVKPKKSSTKKTKKSSI